MMLIHTILSKPIQNSGVCTISMLACSGVV
jgi:hypothetical protein